MYDRPANELYSAKNSIRPIHFYCEAPRANAVCLVGDFNHWDAAACPMHRQTDGWWFAQVLLSHGHHRYRFLVDGRPVLDPRAMGTDRDDSDEEASLVAVS
jgi:1,4-alpha-glucan branching enzyme